MTTKIFEALPPIQFDTNIATIQKLGEQYMSLKIDDLEDKEQFQAVHEARMVMVKVRTTIEKERKAQKAKALEYGRGVDSAARELFDVSNPIEEHLQAEEQKVIDEQTRIKEEAERIEREKIQKRVDAFQSFGVVLPFMDVATMTDEEFDMKLSEAKTVFEVELERLAKEKAEREAEEKRLAEERAELERKIFEQEERERVAREKEEALRREREEFDREKRKAQEEKERAEFEKKAKEEARIDAEKIAKARIEQDKQEAKEREAAKREEAEMRAALLPDKEKLLAWAETIEKAIPLTLALESKEAKGVFFGAVEDISECIEAVKKQAREM